jgi:hypothetical protein
LKNSTKKSQETHKQPLNKNFKKLRKIRKNLQKP